MEKILSGGKPCRQQITDIVGDQGIWNYQQGTGDAVPVREVVVIGVGGVKKAAFFLIPYGVTSPMI
jgi:hypothetical protein